MPHNEEDLFNSKEQIEKLQRNIESTEYFGSLFYNACQKSKDINNGVQSILIELIKTDKDVQERLREEIKNIDTQEAVRMKEKRKTFWNNVFLIVLGALATLFIQYIQKFLQ